jgi:hypothetical protein
MENNQSTPSPQPVVTTSTAAPGVFGTKVPSTVAFSVAVLLFFLPFIDIKCNNMSLQTVSGFQLATGFKTQNNSSTSPLLNELKTDEVDKTITKTTTGSDKNKPNLYAIIALGLGVLGLGLSFTNAKTAISGAIATGIAAAGSLIGLMIDIKKKVRADIPSPDGKAGEEMDNIGKSLTDNIQVSVDFTPWFYVAVVAFLAAAFLAYKRLKDMR